MFTTDRVVRTTDRMKVYNRQFVARTATTDRVMRTTDREYVHTTVSLSKKHNERDNEMVQLTKIILKQTARHTSRRADRGDGALTLQLLFVNPSRAF